MTDSLNSALSSRMMAQNSGGSFSKHCTNKLQDKTVGIKLDRELTKGSLPSQITTKCFCTVSNF